MSEKFRIALIGTGMICNCAHLPAINNLRKKGLAEIVACADIREEAAKETAERWNIPEWYTDPQEMLDKHKDKLDIVAVCTPNLAHKTWSIAALKAGANVMCEKPLALTYRDAKEMFAVADACGKVLFPCQSRRWTNDMVFCKDAMEQAQIGKPYYADIIFCRRYGIPSWGMFHMKEQNGGGPYCDLGVHFVDSLLWMCGNPRVLSVSGMSFDCLSHQGKDIMINIKESGAHAGTVFTPRPYDPKEMSVEEAAMGTIRLEGNFLVNFKFTWALNYPTSRSFVICGPEGGIDAENMKLYKNVGHYQAETDLKYFDNRAYNDVKAFDGHWYMYEHVLRVLKGEEERIVKPRETLNVVASIECFYRSAAEGREVRAEELEGYDYEG